VSPIDNPSAVATLQARIDAMESAHHAIALHANNHQAWENGVAALGETRQQHTNCIKTSCCFVMFSCCFVS
jgi:hypothetical protein